MAAVRFLTMFLVGSVVGTLLISVALASFSDASEGLQMTNSTFQFDLDDAEKLTGFYRFRHYNKSRMQSLAVDFQKQRVYTCGMMGRTQMLYGNNIITEFNMKGDILGHMNLIGFGHCVGIGVQYIPSKKKTMLWTGCANDNSSGRSRRLCKVVYKRGKTIKRRSSANYNPFSSGTVGYAAGVDVKHDALSLRYYSEAKKANVVRLFNLTLANASPAKFVPISPEMDYARPYKGVFQGYTTFGRYMYYLTMDSENARIGYLYTIDISDRDNNHDGYVDKITIPYGLELDHREPEGLSVHCPKASSSNSMCRLVVGMNEVGRKSSLFVHAAL